MKLEELFAQVLGVQASELDEASNPTTIDGWSSLVTIQLLVSVEETYGVRFETQEAGHIWSLGDFRNTLKKHGIDA